MEAPRLSTFGAGALLALLALSNPASAMLDCKRLVVDKHKFDLSGLAGPHSVVTSEFAPPSLYNTTYTLDICAFLKRSDDVPKEEQCTNGARVCAIQRLIKGDKVDTVTGVTPIAGNLLDKGGKDFEWEAKRLKTSESADDAAKEGVRVTLKGGVDYRTKRTQRAVVEFRCNETFTGTEGEWDSEDKYVPGKPEEGDGAAQLLRRIGAVAPREDNKEGETPQGHPEQQLLKDGAALIWEGRKIVDDVETLYLTWHTKYACEKKENDEETAPARQHWGFFTWVVILLFLGIASYLIFGSWLNYNRYGARGWDLLPHGDTLRDVPYLLKDWTRRVLNTVQGSGSRGGYSAV